MKNQVLVKRYTQGLVHALLDEAEYVRLSGQLQEFLEFQSRQKQLSMIFSFPFIPTSRKMEIMKGIFEKIKLDDKTERFLLLLVEKGRWELLPEILEMLPDLWNEEKGIVTFEVSSMVFLSDAQKDKLAGKLERLEQRKVFLKYRIDPDLIGGLSIRKGNIVYDASIKGNLEKLKEKICEG